ncbi:uncharacterized protein LOC123265782 [Cotesia glomerata]|nr:uncharacterized protein LOC123265782 [Cotesia glomerata]XP_044585634.1 uncharacterized protein LOC123265782 [Cotesia glomerata]
MSRTQDKKNLRWSEPVLHRHLPQPLTSENESSSVRHSQSTSPMTKSFEQQQQMTAGCCMCCNEKKIKKSKLKVKPLVQNLSRNNLSGEAKRLQESLELQLIASQVDESLANDKLMALIQHLDLAISILEALLHHLQSLQMLHLSASRIFNLGHQLSSSSSEESNFTEVTNFSYHLHQAETHKEKQLRQLKEIIEICSIDMTVTEQFQTMVKNHLLKREDMIIAAKNFKSLLSKSKLNSSQMKKLLRQYESILNIFQCSRQNLDMELPKMMRLQLISLSQGLQMITQFYNDQDTKFTATLFKLIGDCVLHDLSKVAGHKIEQDICPKCKVNQVDKK